MGRYRSCSFLIKDFFIYDDESRKQNVKISYVLLLKHRKHSRLRYNSKNCRN